MTFWLLKVMFIKSCAQSLCFTYYGTEEVYKKYIRVKSCGLVSQLYEVNLAPNLVILEATLVDLRVILSENWSEVALIRKAYAVAA